MNSKIVIRSETDADASAIAEVTVAAFQTLAISHHTEPFIIAALRVAKTLTVSLVAEMEGRVIGHIAFSPVTLSDGTRNWYGLGPVSVLPAYQRQGVGKALIRDGLSRLKEMKAQGCCLVGHPGQYARPNEQGPPDWTALVVRRHQRSNRADFQRRSSPYSAGITGRTGRGS